MTDKDMDLSSPAWLHSHIQQVITYPLIILRPLFTPHSIFFLMFKDALFVINPKKKCRIRHLRNAIHYDFQATAATLLNSNVFQESWGQDRSQSGAACLWFET